MPIYLDVAGSEGEGDDAKLEGILDGHAGDALELPMRYKMPIYLDMAGSEGEGDDAKGEGTHDSHAVP